MHFLRHSKKNKFPTGQIPLRGILLNDSSRFTIHTVLFIIDPGRAFCLNEETI